MKNLINDKFSAPHPLTLRSLLPLFFLIFVSAQSSAQSVMYCNASSHDDLAAAKKSGFTGMIVSLMSVNPNGDIVFGPYTLCSGGTFTMGNYLATYAADMNNLKVGLSSIRRIEIGIGGWGNGSFDNIKALINAEGTGSGSILYRNFQALKNAIPSIDAINDDDEQTYDAAATVAFAVMLSDLGYHYTLAPYMNRDHWASVVSQINTQRPGALDGVYVQCYAGGAGNNPADWNFGVPVYGGCWNYDSPGTVQSLMQGWKDASGIAGGFMWFEGSPNRHDWAVPINAVFGVPEKNLQEVANFYDDVDYGILTNGIPVGSFNRAQLQTQGIGDNLVSSLSLAKGFKLTVFDGDNLDGDSKSFGSGNCNYVGADFNDRISSMVIAPDGDVNCAGTFFVQNRNSGLYLDIGGAGTDNGVRAIQSGFNGNENQQFVFSHTGGGCYTITAKHSGRVLDVDAAKKDDSAPIQQWDNYGYTNQQFIVVPTDNGYCELVAEHSGKIVEVGGAFTHAGATVNQWTNNNQTCGQWLLVPVSETSLIHKNIGESDLSFAIDPTGNVIRFSGIHPGAAIEVFSLSGMKMGIFRESSITISAWASGTYLARIIDPKKSSTLLKIIKP